MLSRLARVSLGICLTAGLPACSGDGSGRSDRTGGYGYVIVLQSPDPEYGLCAAGYWRAPSADLEARTCDEVELDEADQDCQVTNCPANDDLEYLPAGTLTVEGGLRQLELTPDEDVLYSDFGGLIFEGGEEIDIEVTGGDTVPPHSASVVAPARIEATQPDFTQPMPLDLSQDFTASWDGAGTGRVSLTVSGELLTGGTTRYVSARCEFLRESGQGTIPASVLHAMTDGGEVESPHVWLEAAEESETGPPGWNVGIRVGWSQEARIESDGGAGGSGGEQTGGLPGTAGAPGD